MGQCYSRDPVNVPGDHQSPLRKEFIERVPSIRVSEKNIELHIRTKRRQKNVFEKAPDLSGTFQTARFPKSSAAKQVIKDALMDNFVFSALGPSEIDDFVDYMKMEKFEAGASVIKQGDQGDYFYIVETGTFSFTVNSKNVGQAHAGSSFGELALMYNAPRAATVRAETDAIVWSLNRLTFRTILANTTSNQQEKITESLKKVEILNEVTSTDMLLLAGAVQLIQYSPGDVIITKGDIGNIFYMIKSGTVLCTDVKNVKDLKISSGEYFGEKALLTNEPRAATITAETSCTVMALDRYDFERILGSLKELLTNNFNLRVLKSVPILSKLSDSERIALSQVLTLNTYKRGQVVIQQGDVGSQFFIIKTGEALAKKTDGSTGESQNLKKLRDGDFFGEMALLNEEPRVCNVVCISEVCEVYVLEKAVFNRILGGLGDIMKRTAVKRSKQNEKVAIMNSASTLIDLPKTQLREIAFLGTGTFGRVSLVQDKKNKTVYALKAMSKAQIVAHAQQINVMSEKNTMVLCNSPFILKLHNTYKDSKKLYFLLEYCQGGELFTVLHTSQRDGVPEPQAKFYAVCVLLGLVHMASKNIAYRDLKPENAMVGSSGYVKIIDFGFAKIVTNKTYTLCGTPEYLAPEIVLGRGHNKGVDHWALGILCYEMIAGYSPFADLLNMDQVKICKNIVSGRLGFPRGFNLECKELIKRLLVRDPHNRLGMTKGGAQAICEQPWFANVNFDSFMKKEVEAPWKPDCSDPFDTSNFDPYEQEEFYDPNFVDEGNWDAEF